VNGPITRIINNPKYAVNKAGAVAKAVMFRVLDLLGAQRGAEFLVVRK